ncbi:uncharacterized protein LOC132938548 [Metopolophium dirhodum]|uniref:uncharacterized protein LOC132938548 n=1 Tax=Metopolophium dirhodum TaxID=44670 RepID=UPI00298FB9B9|nr:uncharacterized protein LOC132938548 [Metopolophium dirhodum]
MVMLATVVVEVCDESGKMVQCRAVLDSGSQVNFVKNQCARRLGLFRVDAAVPVTGIGHSHAKSLQYCVAQVHSRVEDVQFNVKLHVLPSITSPLPTQAFNPDKFVIPAYIQNKLADPGYNKPGNVDMLLGAELFFDIMKTDKHVISEQASFQSTVFGWILTARDKAEEEEVDRHFKSTVVRTETGRFMVRLPLKLHPEVIRSTIFMVKRRFFNLEAKLSKDAELAKQYDDFMLEYIKLGHMQPVTSSSSSTVSYYLPHHAVIKDNSITTKLRVVFDASATGSSGMSLNNIMLKGPTVQPTLHSILLRFRTHTFALTADVEKMYRQILVHPDDCKLQRILYRSSPSETLKEYTLRTVTYGTKSAPYLATRCLSQLGSEASRSNTQRTIRMSLRKWCTNSSVLSNQLVTSEHGPNYLLKLQENDTVSTLGVTWNPHADCFQFIVRDWKPPIHMSKRSLLADINKVYDPLGFISPVLVKGKIFVQQLWLLKLGWDTRLPKELQNKWMNFYGELSALEALRILRRVMYSRERIELHGFSDASQEAYGACVYVKTTDDHGQVTVLLYTSKSRVAPTKQTTIPRLELCGAVLLMEIMVDVVDELTRMDIQVNQSNVMLWTDSTIVLAWIKSSQPLKSYVANRVARILDHSVRSQWKHVPTNQNPADIISRGTSAMEIKTNMLWWTGPQWLLRPRVDWPSRVTADDEDIPEVRCIKLTLVAVSASNTVLDRYSEWNSLIRTTGWLLRFSHNAKATKITRLPNMYGPLTVTELAKAQTYSSHLELVNGLTSNAFIAALKRFIGLRGSPQHMYRDNGTNFVGANKELRAYIQQLH